VALGLAGGLLGMAAARSEQREIFGPPPLVEERVDLVIADVHGLVSTARDEGDCRPIAAEESHRVVNEWLKGAGDLASITNVVVEDQRHRR
jgi:hypothetical protein